MKPTISDIAVIKDGRRGIVTAFDDQEPSIKVYFKTKSIDTPYCGTWVFSDHIDHFEATPTVISLKN